MMGAKQKLLVNSTFFYFLASVVTLRLLGLYDASPLRGQSRSSTEGVVAESSHIVEDIVLRFGGDCLLAEHYEEAAGDSVSLAFGSFNVLKSADVAMVNLECPITMRGRPVTKPYNFRMQPRFLSALTSAGIDVVNIANNHIYDFGKIGLYDTISYLDSAGVDFVGAGRNAAQAHAPAIITVRGMHVAFLGYYGGGEAPCATKTRAGVAGRSIESIRSDIASVRHDYPGAYVVVNLHWGTEKAEIPDPEQIEFAHTVIEAGANLIIGHHPHVLQGIESYRSGVIVYSLGNFIFGGRNSETYDTALFEARWDNKGVNYRLIPIRIERWQARELQGEDSESVLAHVRQLSKIFPESIFDQKEAR